LACERESVQRLNQQLSSGQSENEELLRLIAEQERLQEEMQLDVAAIDLDIQH
jgi:hypothetical protein